MTDDCSSETHRWVRRLVLEHQSPLIRYARSFVGDEHLARDLVQEAFLQLCRQSPAKLEGREAAWLYRVCHNLALNRQRKDQRMTISGNLAEQTAQESDPMRDIAAAEERSRLTGLIDQLPERQQQVVRLKFHSGLKYRQISEATGLSESNVGFLLHAALKTLRRRMQTSDLPAQ